MDKLYMSKNSFSLKISQVEVKEVEQVTFPAQETIDQVADDQH